MFLPFRVWLLPGYPPFHSRGIKLSWIEGWLPINWQGEGSLYAQGAIHEWKTCTHEEEREREREKRIRKPCAPWPNRISLLRHKYAWTFIVRIVVNGGPHAFPHCRGNSVAESRLQVATCYTVFEKSRLREPIVLKSINLSATRRFSNLVFFKFNPLRDYIRQRKLKSNWHFRCWELLIWYCFRVNDPWLPR